MKKFFFRIIIFILIAIISILSLLIGTGYSMYIKALKDVSIEEKVEEIKANKNYTDINSVCTMYKDAVVAVEDHRFYEHNGVDVRAIFRAIVTDIKYNELKEGGSTITQQLAKNTYFTQNKELTRKIAEEFMESKYEKNHEKDDILEL